MQETGGAPMDVATYFGAEHAAIYDRRIRQRCPSYEALHGMLVAWLAPLPDAARVLVAGAGTGAEIARLGQRFPGWNFVAADISADMLEICRHRLAQGGIAERTAFHHGQLRDYRADAPFDAATSVLVSHFILDRAERLAYYQAIAESLKPGGVFILADLFGAPGTPVFDTLFESWRVSIAEHGISAEELARDREHVMRDIAFLPEEELMAMLKEAGFSEPVRFYQTWLFGGWVMSKK